MDENTSAGHYNACGFSETAAISYDFNKRIVCFYEIQFSGSEFSSMALAHHKLKRFCRADLEIVENILRAY